MAAASEGAVRVALGCSLFSSLLFLMARETSGIFQGPRGPAINPTRAAPALSLLPSSLTHLSVINRNRCSRSRMMRMMIGGRSSRRTSTLVAIVAVAAVLGVLLPRCVHSLLPDSEGTPTRAQSLANHLPSIDARHLPVNALTDFYYSTNGFRWYSHNGVRRYVIAAARCSNTSNSLQDCTVIAVVVVGVST